MKKESIMRVYDRSAKDDVAIELCTEKDKETKQVKWYIRDPRTKKVLNKESGFDKKPTPAQVLKYF